MNSAADPDEAGLIEVSPVRVRGASRITRRPLPLLPTPQQVHEMADAMPSERYRVMLLTAAWCGLRFGESTELRRKDIVLSSEGLPVSIRVRRAVTRADGEYLVDSPKSAAGVRTVSIPPHIREDVAAYLDSLPGSGEVMLFAPRTGSHMAPSTLYKQWYPVWEAAGLPHLRWHDLRHFSGTVAAQHGATLAELMSRLGHSSVRVAMLYQHAAAERDEAIAAAMSRSIER
jgi:integrase